jgi:hypothetical protein
MDRLRSRKYLMSLSLEELEDHVLKLELEVRASLAENCCAAWTTSRRQKTSGFGWPKRSVASNNSSAETFRQGMEGLSFSERPQNYHERLPL